MTCSHIHTAIPTVDVIAAGLPQNHKNATRAMGHASENEVRRFLSVTVTDVVPGKEIDPFDELQVGADDGY